MPQVNVFRWRAGRGWLVLSGGGPSSSSNVVTIEANMLTHTHSQGPLVYVWAAAGLEQADRHLDQLRELGARSGYLLDILTEDDASLREQLTEAGIVILADGPNAPTLRDALAGPAIEAMAEAHQRGATIYATGDVCPAFGSYFVQDNRLEPGFGWLHNAIIMPRFTQARAEDLRDAVYSVPDAYGLGLGEEAALALGPGGSVEVWGQPAITVALGRDYQDDTDSA